tara:strand:+ start:2334 stop:2489 length:156 start_codon:yes stop_codon:yes gene_type:complete
MSADDIRNSAKDMSKDELLEAQNLCEIEKCLWDEALDVVTHYLTMVEDEEE